MPRRKPRTRTAGGRTTASAPAWPEKLGPGAKFWLTLGPVTRFGDGKAELLEKVDALGSLRQAAQSMGMSYRHAWGLLRELDRAAGFRFLEHEAPGPRTRLRLSDRGRRFLAAYRSFQVPLAELVERRFERVFKRRA